MNFYCFRERLEFILKNRTDGFAVAATSMESNDNGLPTYIIFN